MAWVNKATLGTSNDFVHPSYHQAHHIPMFPSGAMYLLRTEPTPTHRPMSQILQPLSCSLLPTQTTRSTLPTTDPHTHTYIDFDPHTRAHICPNPYLKSPASKAQQIPHVSVNHFHAHPSTRACPSTHRHQTHGCHSDTLPPQHSWINYELCKT